MSNYLAIATVTATLDYVLTHEVSQDVAGVQVTTTRPDAAGAGGGATRINLFLYQVTPSAAARNEDLPTRSSEGKTMMNRPRIGLDLHYLLTFYGSDAGFVPQRLLGSTVKALHARPVLTRTQIQQALTAFPSFPELQSSNLADDIELVKFTQLPLTLEELSKLWSVFFQTTYQLSVAYQGTVVLIESDDSFSSPLPVLSRNVYAYPFQEPRVDAVVALSGDADAIHAGSTVRVRGRRLKGGDETKVSIDGDLLVPSSVTDTEIRVALPASLGAGIHSLQVKHILQMGTPAADHPGWESNVVPFVLTPKIKPSGGGWDITPLPGGDPNAPGLKVGVDPQVAPRQRVSLLLNIQGGTDAYTFPAAPRTAATDHPEFHTTAMTAGTYFARVQIDGADSELVLPADPSNPTVVIP
jgi:hypothetical protein